jgi:hypothetical protein
MERIRETDRKLHGRDGYLVIELIRQLVQIRSGELTSEEARGNAWDKHRIFYVGEFGTTENLLKSMARHPAPLCSQPGHSQPDPRRSVGRNRGDDSDDRCDS